MELMTITAGMILSMFMNMAEDNRDNGFVYNADLDGNKVATLYCYHANAEGTCISNNKKDHFVYDQQNRVVAKETFRWNELSEAWEPVSRMDYSYTNLSTCIDYAAWNASTQSFDSCKERFVYEGVANHVFNVKQYVKDTKSGEFLLADSFLLMGDAKKLLADK